MDRFEDIIQRPTLSCLPDSLRFLILQHSEEIPLLLEEMIELRDLREQFKQAATTSQLAILTQILHLPVLHKQQIAEVILELEPCFSKELKEIGWTRFLAQTDGSMIV